MASTTLKIAVVAPMPSAIVRTATTVNAGDLRSSARRVAQVLPRMVEPEPSGRFEEPLFSAGDVAELSKRCMTGVVGAQPLFLETLGLEPDVGFNLRREIFDAASAPKHRLSLRRICFEHPGDRR